MTPVIQKVINRLQSFQDGADQIVINLVKENEAMVLDMNTDEQLFKGNESTGKPVTPGYRPETIKIKTGLGQPTDRVTLKDTGDFHSSFFINYGRAYFSIWANDSKTKKLVNKYGDEIFGLTKDNIIELTETIRDDLFIEARKVIL